MPGRVLVFDPIVTNRIMLKAQLSIDFFDVTLASDMAELHTHIQHNTPDLILISYHADRGASFDAVQWLRANKVSAYIPLVFLQTSGDSSVWDESHDLMVDDVLQYRAPKWVMASRLNLLIRGKEKLDAIVAQNRTIADMGFAEPAHTFPPTPPRPITLDLSNTFAGADPRAQSALIARLSRDFPNLKLRTDLSPNKCTAHADLTLIDPATLGAEPAFAQMVSLRRQQTSAPRMLFISPNHHHTTIQRALELGANDFTMPEPSVSELACRIRRILWHKQMEHHAEKSVSKHLQSALIDPLTGLYNRRYALQYLNQILTDPTPKKATVTAMVVDLDRFKTINDTYGHLTGDTVIRQTAQRLKQNIRSADLVARLGGEEFLIILKDASGERLRTIAERLRREISTKSFLADDGNAIAVSASIGVSATLTSWPNAKAVIDSADVALYRSKDNGRDRVTFSDRAA